MSEPPYGSLQWQKDRLLNWLLGLWLHGVPADRTHAWIDRLSMTATLEQFEQAKRKLGELRDEEFSHWLLDEAEPWEQTLMLQCLLNLQRAIAAATPGDPVIAAMAMQIRDKDSLRKVLHQTLLAYRPSR